MDSNDNSLSDFVQSLESSAKTEPIKEEPEDDENIDHSYQKIGELVTVENSNNYSINGQKRKSSENSPPVEERMSDNSSELTSNSNKRRRYTDTQLEDPIPNSNIEVAQNNTNIEVNQPSSNIEESQKFTLVVSNACGDWTSEQVLDYIRNVCGVQISKVNDSRVGNSDSDFQIKLNFVSKEQLNRVRQKLKLKEVEGKLTTEVEAEMVEIPIDTKEKESDAESDETVNIGERESHSTESTVRHNQEYETDTSDFHIKENYLQSLGICPPITNWINVTNFRCDKSELKEVLELAGKVLICSVVTTMHKYANAMYSHPLEAVQAVSMLNGQIFYGKKLKVTINNSSHVKTLLPKGLVSVGPGLGKFGKSVQDLSEQYKRFIRGQHSAIDACLFQQELLDKIGVTVDPDNNFTRSIETPHSQTSQNDLCIRNSEDSSENVSQISHMDENQFGPIGQKPPGFHNLPISDYTGQNVNINTNGPNASMNRTCIPNRDPRYNNCPPISGNDEANRLGITSAIISGPHAISGAGNVVGSGSISGSNHMSSAISCPGLLGGPASASMSGSSQISSSGPISGLVPIPNSSSISGTIQISGSGPISAPGPISGPSVMHGPGPLSGRGTMSGPGPMSGSGPASGPGSISRPGLMSSGGPMSGAGSISGPGPVSAHGSMSGPGSISGPSHMSLAGPGTMSATGPNPGPGPMSAPGPNAGPGPMPGPGPIPGLGQMSGSGPMSGRGHMSGPSHMSGPGPMPGPGRMPGPGPNIGACPRPMTGSGLRSGQMAGPRGPGPNQMVHISIGPRVPMNVNRFPGPVSPMVGPRSLVPSGPNTSQIRPNGPRPMASGCNVQMYRSDPVTLQISNLPLNTNFLNLGHKLSELGHVVFLEFTTPGCAVVRFASPADAERCFQLSASFGMKFVDLGMPCSEYFITYFKDPYVINTEPSLICDEYDVDY